jgi:small multidrug resistance pump
VSAVQASWLALVASIGASIIGQGLLKAGAAAGPFRAQMFDVRSLAGLAAYGVAAILYMVALRRLPMSVALPFTAVSYLAAGLVGYFVFAERLNLMQMAAVAVICVGVVMLALGST